jgi:hypothetical protein
MAYPHGRIFGGTTLFHTGKSANDGNWAWDRPYMGHTDMSYDIITDYSCKLCVKYTNEIALVAILHIV